MPELAVYYYAIAINYEFECTETFEGGGNNTDGSTDFEALFVFLHVA